MNERDRRAVENMIRCGISLEDLKSAFRDFSDDDIEAIYNEFNMPKVQDEEVSVKVNCS